MNHLYEVIEKVKAIKTKEEKINFLRQNETWALKDILKGSYDPTLNGLYLRVLHHLRLIFLRVLRLLFSNKTPNSDIS